MQLNTADSSNVDKRHRDQPSRARPKRQPVYQLRCKLIPTLLRRLRFQPGGNLGRLCSSSCPRSGRLLRHVGTLSRACIYVIDRSKSGDLNVRSHYHIEMPRTSIAGGAGAPRSPQLYLTSWTLDAHWSGCSCKGVRPFPPTHYPIAVNKYVNPGTDLRAGSGNGLPLNWAEARTTDVLPMSAAQLGIWFAQHLDPLSAAYNIGEYLEIDGPIDPILFERALQLLVSETETLRVRITEETGEPHQIVTSAPAGSLPIIDVSREIDPRRAAETWMKSDLGQPIDLSREPLFAFALFKASPDRFFWYARYHHVIMDACGMWLVARRVAQLYSLLGVNQSTNLDSPGSLRALLGGDAAYRRSARLKQDQKYWRQYLAGRPTFSKLAACTSPASNGFLRHTAYLPLPISNRLRSLAKGMGTNLSRILAGATAAFLHRLTGESDVLFR